MYEFFKIEPSFGGNEVVVPETLDGMVRDAFLLERLYFHI
jgi:hypothetical protein